VNYSSTWAGYVAPVIMLGLVVAQELLSITEEPGMVIFPQHQCFRSNVESSARVNLV
jgi:hypothetical protein